MVNFSVELAILLVVVVAATATSQSLVAPRMIGGVPIDTLRRFPHHVTIEPIRNYEKEGAADLCGGCILNEQWILTSARCVDQSSRLQLHFEKLYLKDTSGSYTAVVNSDAIHIYPTYYDDIALVKIPFKLIFSDILKPVSLNTVPVSSLQNKLTVLPGFDTASYDTSQLTYGMFNIMSSANCKQYYKTYEFDEFQQLCAVGWSNNPNAPCLTELGSGLIVGWPAKSELVGIYSGSSGDCASGSPGIYMNIAKYASWINSLILS